MCYSASASIVSFASFLVSCSVMFFINKALACSFLFLSLMQIYDYIFWKNQTKNKTNFWLTKAAMLTNHIQPLVFATFIVVLQKQRIRPLSLLFLTFYTTIAILYTIQMWDRIDYTLASEEKSGGALYWEWNYGPYNKWMYITFIITVCLLVIQHFPFPLSFLTAGYLIVSYLFGLFAIKGHTVGRFWCWYAGFMPAFVATFAMLYKYYVFAK